MPVTIEWGNEKKNVSHLKFVGNWDWTEFYNASDTGYQMVESVDHKVHIILDFTHSSGSIPPSAITHFKKSAEKAHPRRGVVILVSQRLMLIKAFVNVIQKVTRIATPILFANSVKEAYATIEHITDNKPETIHLR